MKFKSITMRVSFAPKTIDIDALSAEDKQHYKFVGSTDPADRAMLVEILAKIQIVYNSLQRSLEQNVSTDGNRDLLPGPPPTSS